MSSHLDKMRIITYTFFKEYPKINDHMAYGVKRHKPSWELIRRKAEANPPKGGDARLPRVIIRGSRDCSL